MEPMREKSAAGLKPGKKAIKAAAANQSGMKNEAQEKAL
jgi:hypothetical protein